MSNSNQPAGTYEQPPSGKVLRDYKICYMDGTESHIKNCPYDPKELRQQIREGGDYFIDSDILINAALVKRWLVMSTYTEER